MVGGSLSRRCKASALALRSSGRWVWDASVDLLFPPSCLYCGNETPTEPDAVLLCGACREQMIDRGPTCAVCAANVPPHAPSDGCSLCRERRLRFQAVVRLGQYDGELRAAVLRAKKLGEHSLAMSLGNLLAEAKIAELQNLRADAIVPIPMHWTRRMWRGINSPDVLAERLATALRVPVAAHLLVRRKRTLPQASLPPGQRFENVRGAFRVRPHRDLAGARLLLVDDIMTTGATCSQAAKLLRRAGASFVAVAVLARAHGR